MRTAADKRHYWLRKLHSLTGIAPIGGYLIFHLAENSAVLVSGAQFEANAKFIESFGKLILPVEILLIGSLVFHAVYGLFIVADARPNVARYALGRNWFFTFQRVTGIVALVFLAYHVWGTRVQVYRGELGYGPHVDVTARWMADNIWGMGVAGAAVYLLGAIASTFHLTNGIWSFLIKWGVTVGPTSQRVSGWIWNAVGIVMAVGFVMVVMQFKNYAS